MPDLKQIIDEIEKKHLEGTPVDFVRRKYIEKLGKLTGRNVIVYYSGWLRKPSLPEASINDNDLQGFMTAIHNMDRRKGLDLILHTPGGQIAATESIGTYLRDCFDCDIRAFVPQLAMSAGTMIACSCKEIYMGRQSSLGPIDPQFYIPGIGQIAAEEVLEEIKRAVEEIKKDPASQFLWSHILSKYSPTFIGTCEKAVQMSHEITTKWLTECMFENESNPDIVSSAVVDKISSRTETKSHSRHISMQQCKDFGLKVNALEDDQALQDAVLSVHHACMVTLDSTNIVKLIQTNHNKIYMSRIGIEQ